MTEPNTGDNITPLDLPDIDFKDFPEVDFDIEPIDFDLPDVDFDLNLEGVDLDLCFDETLPDMDIDLPVLDVSEIPGLEL